MADDATYMIRSGVGALERLELIARLCAPATLAFLTRTGALGAPRFLDVGCGIGDVAVRAAAAGATDTVGGDVNAEVVAGAAARAARLGSTARYVTGTFADLGTGDLTGFDVVYARCVLSHLPEPGPAVAAMLRAVRPGGLVLVEDVEVAAVWSSPVEPALVRHVELYVAAARAIGARPDVGPTLAGALRAAGADSVEVDVVQPVLRDPDALRIHARTMEAIADPVLAHGLATAPEIDDLVARLDAWADEPGVVATLPRFVQVAGRRPA
jgi:SAM-dependent methyltransferase